MFCYYLSCLRYSHIWGLFHCWILWVFLAESSSPSDVSSITWTGLPGNLMTACKCCIWSITKFLSNINSPYLRRTQVRDGLKENFHVWFKASLVSFNFCLSHFYQIQVRSIPVLPRLMVLRLAWCDPHNPKWSQVISCNVSLFPSQICIWYSGATWWPTLQIMHITPPGGNSKIHQSFWRLKSCDE